MVSRRQWMTAFKTTLSDLGEDYFDSLYRKVTDREEIILQVLCKSEKEMEVNNIQNIILKTDGSSSDISGLIYQI